MTCSPVSRRREQRVGRRRFCSRRRKLRIESLESRRVLATLLQADFTDAAGFGEMEGFTPAGPANEWHLSTGRGIDGGHSADVSFYFGSGENSFGNGQYGLDADGTLTSPIIDLTGLPSARLTFNHFLEVEAGFDFATVTVLHTGGPTVIATSGTELPNSTFGFEAARFDLTPFVGGTIQIEFGLISDNVTNAEGWYVDDVVVTTPDPPAFGLDFSDGSGDPDAEGFTTSGPADEWHLSTGRGGDPRHSTDDSFYFGSGEGPAGGGSYSNNADGTLTSPAFDLTSAVSPFLTFNHFLDLEPGFDFATVSVLHAGGPTVIATSGVEFTNTTPDFETVVLDLTPFIGESVQFAFRLTSDVSATQEGWYIDDVGVVDVSETLSVVISGASISENGGTTTATVTRSSSTTDPLVVHLGSDDTSEATVPATVTIPAGQTTSAPFTIMGVDEVAVDGDQTVTITAAAALHTDGSDSLSVTDDDANFSVGDVTRVYRLAIAATGEYTSFFPGGQAEAFTTIQSTVAALNAIFIPELSISFTLVSDQNEVYTNPVTDPYTGLDLDAMLDQNQANLDNPVVLGSANYDIGHVFSYDAFGGGGLAELRSVGEAGAKARGATISFDPFSTDFVDTLAHEFGHQFGADHTFNSLTGFCGNPGQYEPTAAYEVASGSTLMSYSGICPTTGGGDNLQTNPDEMFHSASLHQVQDYITGNAHAAPDSTINNGNSIPTVSAGADYVIPAGTPFELTAAGNDSDPADTLSYSWEQLNLGPPQTLPLNDNGTSPLFRTFTPTSNPTRTFPRMSDLLGNVDTALIGEVLPTTNRDLNFRATVRDGNGGVNSDDAFVSVVNTGAPFAVSSPNTAADSWTGNTIEAVTWDVAGTDGNGIDVANVNIWLSTDGGLTFPFSLATTANDGSHDITVPNIDTPNARIKVESAGNIFFDVSNENFTITADSGAPGVTLTESGGSTRVIEGASTDSYEISLNTNPSGDVTIVVSADAQTAISTDGLIFAATQSLTFNSTAPQTVFVRPLNDAVEEGAHVSVLTHAVTASTSATYTVGLLINELSVSVTDDELPPVVGIDFDFVDGFEPAPTNWSQLQFLNDPSPTNMIRDDGVATPIDLRFQFLAASSLSVLTPAISNDNNIPRHSPDIAEIDGFTSSTAGINAIWSDLTPGKQYGIYVFGVDGDPAATYDQNVSIAGATTLPSFDQTLVEGVMQVNDEVGTDTRTLQSYEKIVAADGSGEITITITPNAGSDGIGLAGLAIREIRLAVTVTSTADSGAGSLREAITSANANPNVGGPDLIEFDIPGPGPHVISLLSRLPFIDDPVIIDGTSEPDYSGTPVVQIDGDNAVGNGLHLITGDSNISGLSLTSFSDSGILIFGSGDNTTVDNFVGIDPGGGADGNHIGIKLINSSSNLISGNLVSGNRNNGVFINGQFATSNTVDGNRVGTDADGLAKIPNLRHGVAVWGPNNFVTGNLISGNNGWGVFTRFATGGGNVIDGNLIGVDFAGAAALGNASGIQIRSPNNMITDNTVSGNVQGVIIALADSVGTTVQGNFIGTDPNGTIDIGNSVFGVGIFSTQLNMIGGLGAGQGNVISGNGSDGVILARTTATDNSFIGNKIGTNAAGSAAIPNDGDGVRIVQGASNNTVASNVISGNGVRGVAIDGASTSGNTIDSNFIGTTDLGTAPLHNANAAGLLVTAPNNSITNNVLSAIDVAIVSFTTKATGNTISGNDIGSDPALATPDGIHLLNGAAGTSISGNTVANGDRGIILTNAGNGNDISQNILFGNSTIAIDLNADGATPNDIGDVDEGENRLQNTPVVQSATVVLGTDLAITYQVETLTGSATYPLRIEFFATDDNQARILLGTNTYTAGDQTIGNKTITLAGVASLLAPGDQLTATATDADGNTSELSLMVAIT